MSDLQSLDDDIRDRFSQRANAFKVSSLFIKVVLIIIGSGISAVSHFMVASEGKPLSNWDIVGIVGALAVIVGAIYMALTDDNAAEDLARAHSALEIAKDIQEAVRVYDEIEQEMRRAIELYRAMDQMRQVLEEGPDLKADVIISKFISTSERSLKMALDFKLTDHWTLCVYIGDTDSVTGKRELRNFAGERSVKCHTEAARKWPEGVGISGIAFARGAEVIVPDMRSSEHGSAFDIGKLARDHDHERYGSIACVPIKGPGNTTWGLVVATSERAHHFSDVAPPGVHTVEAVRALAGMASLAVATRRLETATAAE